MTDTPEATPSTRTHYNAAQAILAFGSRKETDGLIDAQVHATLAVADALNRIADAFELVDGAGVRLQRIAVAVESLAAKHGAG